MKLTVRNPEFADMLDHILAFQTEETTDFWSETLYHFYPQLDRAHGSALPLPQRREYIRGVLESIYQQIEGTIQEKAAAYQAQWDQDLAQVEDALSDMFRIDCEEILNDMVCNVTMNPIEPRYLQEHTFDTFYLNSPRGAVGGGIHEIIHFVWFHVWNQVFRDDCEEFEAPSLKWILSEMAVEPIMREERLKSINPYFDRKNGGCVYPYFYTMKIDGQPILDTLYGMLEENTMVEFMRKSYAYCLAHEAEIRNHIHQAERA